MVSIDQSLTKMLGSRLDRVGVGERRHVVPNGGAFTGCAHMVRAARPRTTGLPRGSQRAASANNASDDSS
jgi:hypothetical protein